MSTFQALPRLNRPKKAQPQNRRSQIGLQACRSTTITERHTPSINTEGLPIVREGFLLHQGRVGANRMESQKTRAMGFGILEIDYLERS